MKKRFGVLALICVFLWLTGATPVAEGFIEVKTSDEFNSGEVSWRLQNGQANQSVQVWSQKLSDPTQDLLPLHKTTNRVYLLTQMKGNGTDVHERFYRNESDSINLNTLDGYKWLDSIGTAFTTINDAADHTITPTVTTLPTATAVYGPSSKLAGHSAQ